MTVPIVPLKRLATIIPGQSPASDAVTELEDGQPFLQGNAEFGALHPRPKFECEVPAKSADVGDILLSVRAPVGAINIADRPVGIGRGLAAIRCSDQVDPRFLRHTIQSLVPALRSVSTGTTYEAVSSDQIGALPVSWVALGDQRRIAEFLDDQVTRIDNIIAARRRQISLDVEEFASGVRFSLRDLSNEVEVAPLRRFSARTVTGGTPGSEYDDERGYRWYTPASIDVLGQLGKSMRQVRLGGDVRLFDAGSVLLVGIGATAGRVAHLDHVASGNQQLTALTPTNGLDSWFLYFQLKVRTEEMLKRSTYTTLPIINNATIRDFRISVPDRPTQSELVDSWSDDWRRTQSHCALLRKSVGLLLELKLSLITAAVTGEFDVGSADGSRVLA